MRWNLQSSTEQCQPQLITILSACRRMPVDFESLIVVWRKLCQKFAVDSNKWLKEAHCHHIWTEQARSSAYLGKLSILLIPLLMRKGWRVFYKIRLSACRLSRQLGHANVTNKLHLMKLTFQNATYLWSLTRHKLLASRIHSKRVNSNVTKDRTYSTLIRGVN